MPRGFDCDEMQNSQIELLVENKYNCIVSLVRTGTTKV